MKLLKILCNLTKSTELTWKLRRVTESNRFLVDFVHYTVSDISLIMASIEADMIQPSCTGLSRYFEPYFGASIP